MIIFSMLYRLRLFLLVAEKEYPVLFDYLQTQQVDQSLVQHSPFGSVHRLPVCVNRNKSLHVYNVIAVHTLL